MNTIATVTAPEGQKKNTKKWLIKKPSPAKLVLVIVLLGVCIGACVGVYQLFFTEEEKIALTGTTTYGSLNETIEGSGTTTPADSATYTLSGTVMDWCVEAGDTVEVGDLLYVLDSSEAEDEILEYEIELEDLYEQLADLQENIANQQITADFSGRIEAVQGEVGQQVQGGAVLANLIDDSVMTATLYFSYQYQDVISKGMEVSVSVPDQQLSLTGTVSDIQYVDYHTPEGMQCFGVTVQVENPGSLTEGNTVTCWLTGTDGTPIYAVDDATLSYLHSQTITTEVAGELSGVHVVDYQRVNAGDLLFTVDGSGFETQMETVQKQIDNHEKNIADLQESIATEYTRYSDIAGQVVTAFYTTDRMTGNDTGSVVVYNQDSMEITVNIDELNADLLEVGMPVQVYRTTASETIFYDATLTYLSLEATSNTSGVSTFEATITIDSKGELSSGVTVYYSIDTSGEGDTGESVLAPVDALCTYDDGYYLLVQADQQPGETIDPTQVGGSVTEYPEGYYAVPVEVGDYNGNNIQILSGVSEDTTVFLRYQNARPTGGDTTSEGGSQSEEQTGRPSGEMPSGEMMQIPAFGNMGAGGTGGMGTGAMGGGMPSGRG